MAVERIEPGTDGWRLMIADHLARYRFALPWVQGKRVLDAGTGCGYGAALLASSGAKEVLAIDIDEQTIGKAKHYFGKTGVTYLRDNCETFAQIDGLFDVIVNFENIEHLQHPQRFLEVAAKHLEPDGLLLVSTPNADIRPQPDGKPINPYHVQEWSVAEFESMLGNYFGGIEMQVQICSAGLLERRAMLEQMQSCLIELYESPLVKLSRHLRKWFSRGGDSNVWPFLVKLKPDNPEDFPIVPAALAEYLGKPICAVAICTEPLTASSAQPRKEAA